MALTACTGVGDKSASFTKTGEIAGTAGLQVAAKKCASLEGTKDWQACVAHYDGLYTKRNGTIVRSYNLSADAPVQTGKIETCSIKATFDSQAGAWNYSSCNATNGLENFASNELGK